jgi:hypothetical protein
MCRHSCALLFAVLLLVPPTPPLVRAAERCTMSCRAEVAACKRSECGSERGTARRLCIEKRCRGPLGCPARIRTLAYVVTGCRAQNGGSVGFQELRIRRGDCDPVTVMRVDSPGEARDPYRLCEFLGSEREGYGS